MYKKTHGNFAPGEQVDREYIWPVDKTSYRFGYGEPIQVAGVARSLHAERPDPNAFPKTVIVKKTVEDVKATQSDILGKPRNLGQGQHPLGPDHVFGIKNTTIIGEDSWNAARCLHGEPSEKQLEPDRDLGKCVKPGSRN